MTQSLVESHPRGSQISTKGFEVSASSTRCLFPRSMYLALRYAVHEETVFSKTRVDQYMSLGPVLLLDLAWMLCIP